MRAICTTSTLRAGRYGISMQAKKTGGFTILVPRTPCLAMQITHFISSTIVSVESFNNLLECLHDLGHVSGL